MKKVILLILIVTTFVGCRKQDFYPTPQTVSEDLKIATSTGIKLQTVFVTNEVSMNVKTEFSGKVTIKIFDIANKVVSKETTNVSVGDNILKVYTSALPSTAYRIGLYDTNNTELGITDFVKK